ncbi:hypothetical protein PanWU01x14_085470 [Parasponia andersonii]|uniref:Uncharacterized protein n=1 Tax=Parasponia andersonii TaxID=3476 RepID=A0A2P5D8X8_PARAD|nr:hypothetical protein PanWU01x14_085470 [Parasponia andersonii]
MPYHALTRLHHHLIISRHKIDEPWYSIEITPKELLTFFHNMAMRQEAITMGKVWARRSRE